MRRSKSERANISRKWGGGGACNNSFPLVKATGVITEDMSCLPCIKE